MSSPAVRLNIHSSQ